MPTKLWFHIGVAAVAVTLALFTNHAPAGTIASWTGGAGNGDWSNAGNWTGTPPSSSGTFSLVFGGSTQVSTTNSFSPMTIDSLAFTNSGSISQDVNSFTISGSTLNLVGGTITTAAATNGVAYNGERIASNISLSGSNFVTIGANHPISISGIMSGTGSVTYGGAGSSVGFIYLSGSNTYSGNTFITGANVQVGDRTNGISNSSAFGTGVVSVSGSGTLLVRYSSTVGNNLFLSGTGVSGNAVVGSFASAGSTATLSGTVTLAADATMGTASSAAGDTTSKLVVSGPVNLGSSTLTFRPGRTGISTAGLLIDVTNQISGSGNVVVNASNNNGVGPVRLSGSNSYTGSTTISSGTLIAANANALGNGGPLIVNTSGLDLNGFSVNAGALSGSATGVIQSNVAGDARLITSATTNSVFAGSILNGSGTVGLTKAGAGVLSLTGSNGYTGSTAINGGVLALDAANAIAGGGDVTFGGGTLRYSSSNTSDVSSRIKNSGSAISLDTNGQTVTFAGAVANSNTAGLTKTGSGTLYLNAANQYAGTTAVDVGTLAGTGSVLGLLSVGAGAVFDPGASPSATAIFGVGAFAQAAGGTTKLQVTGTTAGTQYDQVSFSGGAKTVSWGGVLDLTLSGSYANYTQFNLFSGFTSQTGNLSSIAFTGSGSPYSLLSFLGPVGGQWWTAQAANGQALTFDQATGVLTVVPEPSVLALLGGAGFAMACWRGLGRRGPGRRRAADGGRHGG